MVAEAIDRRTGERVAVKKLHSLFSNPIEALRIGETPTFAAEDEAAVHAFALEAQTARRVSDATYARAVAALGEDGVVDLVGILGYYSLISLTLNIFEVMPPEGEALAFE